MVLIENSFGSGADDDMFSGKEYLLDLTLTGVFFLATTLLGEDVDVVLIDDTLVLAGEGGAGNTESRSVVLGGGCVVPGGGPVFLLLFLVLVMIELRFERDV